ncbi:M23 family peptidase [Paraburkholderia phymatum]|uniref:M23 family peptidase n=1 Tax=Paraburkholderia phymatum TaxID=148447 RepID=A0ACC6U2F0_9BURK
MIISPPLLPTVGAATTPDPLMDAVDAFALKHGIYPVAFDRRWHCGQHLDSGDQHSTVHAIADGEVVAYRVCQSAVSDGTGQSNSNAGFVLLKHSTETGENRSLTYYSLYMHLLDIDGMNALGIHPPAENSDHRKPYDLASWLLHDTGGAVSGGNKHVHRKDAIGYVGKCHGVQQLHFEIFMTQPDFEAYFKQTQLGRTNVTTPAGTDYWGHSYYVIPAGRTFLSMPPGTGADQKLHGIKFAPGQGGRNALTLHVEVHFHRGDKYTNVWSVAADGSRTLLTSQSDREINYEYDLYKRASSLYPSCPSDGYELLRFGRILSANPTLASTAQSGVNPRATWLLVTFAAGQKGYIDVSNEAVQKLSDADFPFFTGWQKVSDANTPFDSDGLCDVSKLRELIQSAKATETPAEKQTPDVDIYRENEELSRYVNDPSNQGISAKVLALT